MLLLFLASGCAHFYLDVTELGGEEVMVEEQSLNWRADAHCLLDQWPTRHSKPCRIKTQRFHSRLSPLSLSLPLCPGRTPLHVVAREVKRILSTEVRDRAAGTAQPELMPCLSGL